MGTLTSTATRSPSGEAMPPVDTENFLYRTIAIYPDFADVGGAIAVLKTGRFTIDQISLLGREQEHWKEQIGAKWEALNTAKGALGGAALGSIPGLVLVAGIALTGGVGLLVAGPMAAAMGALGMGALGGSLVGGATNNLGGAQKEVDIETEMENAISKGQWVVIAHSHDEAEALRAQALLPNSRIILSAEADAKSQENA